MKFSASVLFIYYRTIAREARLGGEKKIQQWTQKLFEFPHFIKYILLSMQTCTLKYHQSNKKYRKLLLKSHTHIGLVTSNFILKICRNKLKLSFCISSRLCSKSEAP